MSIIGNQDPTALRHPLVHQSCESIDNELSSLQETVNELISRLTSVLRDEPPNVMGVGGTTAGKDSTPLSDRLDGYVGRIAYLRNEVLSALHRLEI